MRLGVCGHGDRVAMGGSGGKHSWQMGEHSKGLKEQNKVGTAGGEEGGGEEGGGEGESELGALGSNEGRSRVRSAF